MPLYDQANLKVITCAQKKKKKLFFYGDDDELIYFIIGHLICLVWPVVQARHNFKYSSQCICEGKYYFLNLFVCCFLLCRYKSFGCIIICESIVNK